MVELSKVLRKQVKFHDMMKATVSQILILGLDMTDQVVSNAAITAEAMKLAIQTCYPVYDCFYLTLARRTPYALLTHDKKLKSLARSLDIAVI